MNVESRQVVRRYTYYFAEVYKTKLLNITLGQQRFLFQYLADEKLERAQDVQRACTHR